MVNQIHHGVVGRVGPRTGGRIVECALGGPDGTAVVVFATHDGHFTVGKSGRTEVERVVSGWQTAGVDPGAVDVASGAIRNQAVPSVGVGGEEEAVHKN